MPSRRQSEDARTPGRLNNWLQLGPSSPRRSEAFGRRESADPDEPKVRRTRAIEKAPKCVQERPRP